jgi:mannose-1-phosphate guanylyltransferase/mannose-6-phosphate isomerase
VASFAGRVPKKFLCLTGADSLFQQAVKRLMGLGIDYIQVADPLVVTGENHRFLATEQLREVGISPTAALFGTGGQKHRPR